MNRTKLVQVLKKAEPALSTGDFIPIFQSFFFDGQVVLACDDIIAIRLPCSFPLEGCVDGKTLLNWLTASKAGKVDVEVKEGTAHFKMGRSRLKLSVEPEESFLFDWPERSKAQPIRLDSDLLAALKKASICMGRDPAHPWRIGVTMKFGKKSVVIYASDNLIAAQVIASVKAKSNDGSAYVLPPKFVDLILKQGDECDLHFGDGYAEARFASGLLIWTKTGTEVLPENFEQPISGMLDEAKESGDFVSIPKGFDTALKRAMAILASATDRFVRCKIQGDKLILSAVSPKGELRETFTVKGHAEVEESFPAQELEKGVAHTTEMQILKGSSAVLRNGDQLHYFVSSIAED